MQTWQEFELLAFNHLKKKYNSLAKFEHLGQSDSTTSDISYTVDSSNRLFIEVKKNPSQSGQFVVTENKAEQTFSFSPRNINENNDYSKSIIEYMNSRYSYFSNPSTSGCLLTPPNEQSLFANWIISMYRTKSVTHIITQNFLIIPIEEIQLYFDISATYRVKKSGSSNVGKKNIPIVEDYLKKIYNIKYFKRDHTKLFFSTEQTILDKYFFLNNNYFFLSEKSQNFYEIRKLSSTNNANVIFTIKLNEDTLKNIDSLQKQKNQEFKEYLTDIKY